MGYLKSFIGWLAVSFSGILAVGYGVGFLVLRSHLHMLGLDYVFDVRNSEYIEEGGKFFYNSSILLIDYLLDITKEIILLISIVIGALATITGFVLLLMLIVIYRFNYRKLKEFIVNTWSKIKSACKKIFQFQKLNTWYVQGVLSILIYTFFIGALPLKDVSFFAPISVSGVLYYTKQETTNHDNVNKLEDKILKSIREGEEDFCNQYYTSLLVILIVFGLILLTIKKFFLLGLFTRLCYIPLFLVFLICLLIIPLTYGVLIVPNVYPKAAVSAKEDAVIEIPEGLLYLINRDERELVLWDDRLKQVYITYTKDIATVKIIGQSNIFKPCDYSILLKESKKQG